jgi:hypothetical protein
LHAAEEPPGILRQGTPIRLIILRTLSSAEAQEGDTVDFQTLDDITVNGAVIIPSGAKAIATVTVAEPRKSFARSGKLVMNLDYVQLPEGGKLRLRGVEQSKGGAHVTNAGGMVANAIVSAPLLLFMHGKDASIPEGREFTVFTNSDYKVHSGTSASPAVGNHLINRALTETDILKLKLAGLSDEIIMQKIASSPVGYDTSIDELLRLKQAGFSDPIIRAMMTAATKH